MHRAANRARRAALRRREDGRHLPAAARESTIRAVRVVTTSRRPGRDSEHRSELLLLRHGRRRAESRELVARDSAVLPLEWPCRVPEHLHASVAVNSKPKVSLV